MPFKVIIAGAGLGGLGAAIAMARAGHNVDIFEQSRFLNEIGPAIHIAPNATRVLRSWDIDFTELPAVLCNAIKIYDHTGKPILVTAKLEELQKSIGSKDEWLLTHRVDLHNSLRKAAMEKTFAGAIKIRAASKVAHASKVVCCVAGSPPVRVSTKQNVFRFLVPIDKLMANPVTGPFFEKLGFDCQHVFTTRDRRMVVYACKFVPDAELPPNIFPYLWNNFVLDDAKEALAAAA
ncbi:3-hydroxybenzoate 6-hydroxylase 1 [Fusarium coicis]|nr:3-hydroxybenzoate 6-hydroxylase 1 [Fusarium coicis]